MLQIVQLALVFVLPTLVIVAAVYDLLTMTIPNRISIVLVAAFAVSLLPFGLGWFEIASHIGAGALVLVVGLGLFAAGWVGGGDVKLAAAISLWLGFDHLLDFLMISALAGGALTLIILAFRFIPMPDGVLRMTWLKRLHNPTTGVPYGVALSFGALTVFPSSVFWVAAFPG